MPEKVWQVHLCNTCGAQVDRDYNGRWECKEHSDAITVRVAELVVGDELHGRLMAVGPYSMPTLTVASNRTHEPEEGA